MHDLPMRQVRWAATEPAYPKHALCSRCRGRYPSAT